MRVNLVCGFLGSGKTTLMRRILAERRGRERMAVIVNEFGQVGIDGQILEGTSVDVVELTAGCFCCMLKGSLVSAVEELRDVKGVERIAIESSGVSQPGELVGVLRDPAIEASVSLGPVVTVVDASRFAAHRKVLGGFYTDQVKYADVVLLNKRDLTRPDALAAARDEIRALNPRARVVETERCDVELATIMDTGDTAQQGRAPEPSALEQGLASPAPAASFVSFVLPAPFDAEQARVERFFRALPANVTRAKGFMTIDGQPRLVQFASGQLEITPAAAARSLSVVFIGDAPDRVAIEAGFRATAKAATP